MTELYEYINQELYSNLPDADTFNGDFLRKEFFYGLPREITFYRARWNSPFFWVFNPYWCLYAAADDHYYPTDPIIKYILYELPNLIPPANTYKGDYYIHKFLYPGETCDICIPFFKVRENGISFWIVDPYRGYYIPPYE